MYLTWCILLFFISRHPGTGATKPGYALVLEISGKSHPIYCLTTLRPNSSQIFPSTWKPQEDASITQENVKCDVLLLEHIPMGNGFGSGFRKLALVADGPEKKACMEQIVQTYPQSIVGSLPVTEFKQLSASTTATNHLRLERDSSISTPKYLSSLLIFAAFACAILSILLACVTILVSWDTLLQQFHERSAPSRCSTCSGYLQIALLLVFASVALVLYYYFYDYFVYIAIALFFIGGTFSITSLVAFWIMYFFPRTRKRIPVNFHLCKRSIDFSLPITELCIIPMALSVTITWLVFRKDPNIGWPMQSVIAAILIARALSAGVIFPSLKLITVAFIAFMLYDAFFVFITPLLSAQSTASTTAILPDQATLERRARSVPTTSVMEAVALGSAGKSGEGIPWSFRFQYTWTTGVYQCTTSTVLALVGLGDAGFPGILCAFLAFFDSAWRIRFRRNMIACFLGYIIGLVIAELMVKVTDLGQPALLYLCPCTLATTVLSSGIFGGIEELRRLWNGMFPVENNWLSTLSNATGGDGDTKGVENETDHAMEDLTHSQIALVARV